MITDHPPDRILAALADTEARSLRARRASRHLASCGLCQLRLGQIDDDVASSTENVTKRLVGSGGIEVPDEDRKAPPSVGQIWRIEWEGFCGLAVLRGVHASTVSVVPVLDDSDSADEWCVVLQSTDVSPSMPVAVSVALEAVLPRFVLDTRIGQIEPTGMESIDRVRDAFRSGRTIGSVGVSAGRPIVSLLDNRREELDLLRDNLELLSRADWTASSGSASELISLGEVSYEPFDAASLTEVAAALLEASNAPFGHDAQTLPEELRLELDRPEWRPRLRSEASRLGTTEGEVRLTVARSAVATGRVMDSEREADWAARVDAALND